MSDLSKLLLFAVAFTFHLSSSAQTPGAYKALNFDGSNDDAWIDDDTSLNPRDEMTVEAWIKPESFGVNAWSNSIFCKHGWASGNAGYVLRCGDGGKLSFNVAGRTSGSWEEAVTSVGVLKAGQWYHVAGTFDGDSVNLYLNGVLQATHLYTGQINISSGLDPRIGELANGGGRNFDGTIDEVRVWNRALSEIEIRRQMCQKIGTTHPKYGNLAGAWHLDEGTGTTTDDYSNRGNDATLRNGPVWIDSKAAIGDTSVMTSTSSALTLGSQQGDFMHISAISGSPRAVHLYLVNDTSTQPGDSTISVRLDSSHYYGVYVIGGSSVKYTASLDIGGHPVKGTADECGLDMLLKEPGIAGIWASTNSAEFFTSGDSLVVRDIPLASEIMIGVHPFDSTSVLKSSSGYPWICGSDSLALVASGNSSFSFKWYKDDVLLPNDTTNILKVIDTGDYHVEVRRSSVCNVTSTKLHISKRTKPTVSLSSIPGICEDVDSAILTGGSPKGGWFTVEGLVDDSLVYPRINGTGSFEVIYNYADPSSQCIGKDTQVLDIWALPKVGVSSGTEVCNNIDSLQMIHGIPAGGVYTGTGVKNGYFYPLLVGFNPGNYPYTYTFTDTNGCVNSYTDSVLVKETTDAFFNAIPDLCEADESVDLTAFPKGGSFSGTGIVGTTFDPAVAKEGSHELRYTYKNSEGCTDIAIRMVNVFRNTPTTWNYTLTACNNADSIQLAHGSPSPGKFSGQGVTSSSGYFHPLIAGSGTHTLTYNYIDTNGCDNKVKRDVTVNDTATLQITSAIGEFCPARNIKLDHVSPSGGTYSGNGVSGDTLFGSLAGAGEGNVRYAFTNKHSCVSATILPFFVITPENALVSVKDSMCAGEDPVQVTINPPGGTLSGKGIISTLFSPNFAGAGSHEIKYEYIDSNFCTITVFDTVHVGEEPDVMLAAFASVCQGDQVFTIEGGSPTGGKYIVDDKVEVFFYPGQYATGQHDIRYVYFNAFGCGDSAEQPIFVNEHPAKPVITILGNVLTSSANQGNQWYDMSGEISGETGKTLHTVIDGDYYVVVTNDSGCSTGSDTVTFTHIGVHDQRVLPCNVYPNPSHDGLFFVEDLAGAEFRIYDATARLILEGRIDSRSGQLDLRNSASGIYHVEFTLEGRRYSTRVEKR